MRFSGLYVTLSFLLAWLGGVRVAHGVESDDSHINSQTDQSSNAQHAYLRYFPSLLVANALS